MRLDAQTHRDLDRGSDQASLRRDFGDVLRVALASNVGLEVDLELD